MFTRSLAALCTLGLLLASCAPARPAAATPTPGIERIGHVIVVYLENRSFDGLYGSFPGANGLPQAGAIAAQLDKTGNAYATLPRAMDNSKTPAVADPRFPVELANRPFDIATYAPADQAIGNPVHRFYQEQLQIDGGKMDRFVAWTDVGGLVMGTYDAREMPIGRLAAQYTLSDNFFHAAFGGSFLNHMWLACACTPAWPDAPKARVAQLDPDGRLAKDGDLTPDGFVVNTTYTVNAPHPKTAAPADLLPSLTNPTIGDRLTAKGIDWAWYSGGWDDAIAGKPDPTFVFHHQPFAYFAPYADGTDGRRQHLKDERDFMSALRDRTLPAVSFVKPVGADSGHPKYGDVKRGEDHVAALVKAVQDSDYWKDTVIVLTYDENGGFWDHVAPPTIDRWGPGTRVPTIVVSPFAKKGYIDHTRYDTTSILRLIELRWNLDPLGPRDAAADPLTGAFGF